MLAGGGIQRRNPCPQCGEAPQLLVGIVLGWDQSRMYLVCWPCGQARAVIRDSQWVAVPLPGARTSFFREEEEDDRPRRPKRGRRYR